MKKQLLLWVGALTMALMPSLLFAESNEGLMQINAEHPTGFEHRHKRAKPPTRRAKKPVRVAAPQVYFGIGGMGNYMVQTDEDLSRIYKGGGGIDLMIGATLSPHLVGEVSYFAAPQKTDPELTGSADVTALLMSVGVDMKIYPTTANVPIAPFVQIGAGGYIFHEIDADSLTGGGFRVGGGVDVGLGPFMKFSFLMLYHGFYMDNSDEEFGIAATDSAYLNIVTGSASVQFLF